MIPVKIDKSDIVIKNVEINELDDILFCINQSEDNARTLGRDSILTFEDLRQRYLETLTNSLEFFCSIYKGNKMIGIIKGRIENKTVKELWIMSIMIIKEYRRKKLGTTVVCALEDYFLYNFSINKSCALVMEDNLPGQNFWIKNGYKIKRVTKGVIDDKTGMVIFEKKL